MSKATTLSSFRQPLSVLGRTAFIALLIATIIGAIGVTLLTVFAGAPSPDSVRALISFLVATLLVLSGNRWLQLVASLVGAYILYQVFTEPFVVESLANPKDMQAGGYGHFIGDIVIITCVLIGFGASVGATAERFLQGDRQSSNAPCWYAPALTAVLGMAVGALFIGAIAQPTSNTGVTLTNGEPTIHMTAGNFAISTVTIVKGSKLLLIDDTSALHILENGSWQNTTPKTEREANAPLVDNMRVQGGSVEIGPFPVAGTYHIYCTVHAGMNLTITVQ